MSSESDRHGRRLGVRLDSGKRATLRPLQAPRTETAALRGCCRASDGLETVDPLLTMERLRQLVAVHGTSFRLICPFSLPEHFAAGCHPLRPLGSINAPILRCLPVAVCSPSSVTVLVASLDATQRKDSGSIRIEQT